VGGPCEHGKEASGSINAGKFLSSYTIDGFSRRGHLHGVSLVQWYTHVLIDLEPRHVGSTEYKYVLNINHAIVSEDSTPFSENFSVQ
jgi:hypothetical protein